MDYVRGVKQQILSGSVWISRSDDLSYIVGVEGLSVHLHSDIMFRLHACPLTMTINSEKVTLYICHGGEPSLGTRALSHRSLCCLWQAHTCQGVCMLVYGRCSVRGQLLRGGLSCRSAARCTVETGEHVGHSSIGSCKTMESSTWLSMDLTWIEQVCTGVSK